MGEHTGHTNPTLELVRLLTSSGCKASYFITEFAREEVEKVGAVFFAYGPNCFGSQNTTKLMDVLNYELVEPNHAFPDLAAARQRSIFNVYVSRNKRDQRYNVRTPEEDRI